MPTNHAARDDSQAPPDGSTPSVHHAHDPAQVAEALHVDPQTGLSGAEAAQRILTYGPNELRSIRRITPWQILVAQTKSLVMGLLAVAAVVSWFLGDTIEAFAILILLAINIGIGFLMESRALRSMEALRRLGSVHTRVRRDGEVQSIPSTELVPGDIILLDAGDIITSDARLIHAARLDIDESLLTGESVPATKTPNAVAADTHLNDRACMLYKGTLVARGTGEAVVVATGARSELGRISRLVAEAETEATPLEERLEKLGRRLMVVALILVAIIGITGILRGKPVVLMLEIAVALAVAAIPEGLPIVATLALAKGMMRMAGRNALVRRLAAVETLGSTGVICCDKTGTLTENRLSIARIATADSDWLAGDATSGPVPHDLLRIGTLCNGAVLAAAPEDGKLGLGSAMELALLDTARRHDIHREALLEELPEILEEPFDPTTRRMVTVHAMSDARALLAIKGAPETILGLCQQVRHADGTIKPLADAAKASWLARNDDVAADGLRVIALASHTSAHDGAFDATAATNALERIGDKDTVLEGLVGFLDPSRPGVAEAVRACQDAGIEVVMITGDQAATATRIAVDVGILSSEHGAAGTLPEELVLTGPELETLDPADPVDDARIRNAKVFARAAPEQKLVIVKAHQHAKQVVAMTGDGVNDAPALRQADIGVAMGQRGTEAAREASDVILKDDSFPTIVTAVRQGRTIFTNIRRFTYYLLSCNLGEVAIIGGAIALGTDLPLTALQILFLNLVTDVFPALALGFGEGDDAVMKQRPRPEGESFLTNRHWRGIFAYGLIFMATILGAFLWMRHLDATRGETLTVSFLTLALAQLWHVFNMRDPGAGLLNNDVVRNRWVWGAVGLCLVLLGAAIVVPRFAAALGLVPLSLDGWRYVVGFSFIPFVVGQVWLLVRGRMIASKATG